MKLASDNLPNEFVTRSKLTNTGIKMLWFLQDDKNNVYYITNEAEQIIGRGGCQLSIPNDQSVSRKHASICIQNSTVQLKDLESRYGTFINQDIDTNRKVPPNEVRTLQIGDRIRFGMQWNIWHLKAIVFKTIISTLSSEQANDVKCCLKELNGNILTEFDDSCSHVTMEAVQLTIKFVLGLVKGLPIVTTQYWKDCVDAFKNNRILPDASKYVPTFAEQLINKDQRTIEYNVRRKELFAGKFVLFPNELARRKMQKLIELAGGQVGLWSSSTREDMIRDNVIVVHTMAESQDTTDINEIRTKLDSHGLRLISETEIAMAIWNCDITVNCNPKCRVVDVVFANKDTQLYGEDEGDILVSETAPNTQYDNFNPAIASTMQDATCKLTSTDTQPNFQRKRSLDSDDAINSVEKRRKEELPTELCPIIEKQKTEDSIIMETPEGDSSSTNPVNTVPTLKRKYEEEVVIPSAKRVMVENRNGLDTPLLVSSNLLSKIYVNSGWLSKTFIKMEIKEEEDGQINKEDGAINENDDHGFLNSLKNKIKIETKALVLSTRTLEVSKPETTPTKHIGNTKVFKKTPVLKAPLFIPKMIRTTCKVESKRPMQSNDVGENYKFLISQ